MALGSTFTLVPLQTIEQRSFLKAGLRLQQWIYELETCVASYTCDASANSETSTGPAATANKYRDYTQSSSISNANEWNHPTPKLFLHTETNKALRLA